MDISDPLKYDQILKFSLSASQWSQRALKREYLPSMYVNSRRKSKLPSSYRYIDKNEKNMIIIPPRLFSRLCANKINERILRGISFVILPGTPRTFSSTCDCDDEVNNSEKSRCQFWQIHVTTLWWLCWWGWSQISGWTYNWFWCRKWVLRDTRERAISGDDYD